jgi:predicted DsbA family dithiol-disulfide isomerase
MPVEARFFTDPACPWSWAMEPEIQRLRWEFGEDLAIRPVMGGLARTYEPEDHAGLVIEWLEAAERSGMPIDPLLWRSKPLSSTYPACQAVKAAAEQGPQAELRYLRRMREGILVERRRLDHAEALVAEAGTAGLDVERFEIDLRSHAIVEAFAADLEETRSDARIRLPSLVFTGEDGSRHGVYGPNGYDAYREAATAAGASPTQERRPDPADAIERLGPLATAELEALTGKPRPVLEAELWSAARDWRLRPDTTPAGTLWSLP